MDIKKIIIKRGIIKRENGGWGKDRPYTEGKSVLGSDGFSRVWHFSRWQENFSAPWSHWRDLQPRVVGFYFTAAFLWLPGGYVCHFQKMQFVFQDPLTIALDTTNPLLSPCVCFPPMHPPQRKQGDHTHVLHTCSTCAFWSTSKL